MKARKAVPAKSKVALREPAKPLVEPERRAVPADHPAMEIFRAAQAPPDNRLPVNQAPLQSSTGTPPQTEVLLPDCHPLTIDHLLPPNAPHLRTPYAAIDRLRQLSPGPRVVCEEIYRAAAGWHSDECTISIPKLAVYCKIDEKYVRKYLAQLQSLAYIERLGTVQGGPDVSVRGVRFRILLPRLAPPDKKTPVRLSGGDNRPPIKENALNKDSKSTVCDLCKDTSGFIYKTDNSVERCKHEKGK